MITSNILNTVATNGKNLVTSTKNVASWCGRNVSYALGSCQLAASKAAICGKFVFTSSYYGMSMALRVCASSASSAWKFSSHSMNVTANKIAFCTKIIFGQIQSLAKISLQGLKLSTAFVSSHPTTALAFGGVAFGAAGWAAYNRTALAQETK